MADNIVFEALKHEDALVNGRMQELYKALYAILGAVLPGTVAIFTFLAKEQNSSLKIEVVAFAFIAVFSLASLWANSLWMDLFPFIRYRYLILQPQILRASGQEGRASLVAFVSPRPFLNWVPTLAFTALSVVLLSGVWLLLVPAFEILWWGSALFVAATMFGNASVLMVARTTGKELASLKAKDV